MENLSMCRICLAEDVQMHLIRNTHLQETYESLTMIPFETEDSRPARVCYICFARLRNCYQLKKTSLQSEELFKQMLISNKIKPVTPQDESSRHRLGIVHPVVHLSVGDTLLMETGSDIGIYEESFHVEVKQEECGDMGDGIMKGEFGDHDIPSSDPDNDPLQIMKKEVADEEITITNHSLDEYDRTQDDSTRSLDTNDNNSLQIVNVETQDLMKPIEDTYINSFKSTRGGVKLNWNGFIYEKNRSTAERQYWVCELRSSEKYQCKSRVTTEYDVEKEMFKLISTSNYQHNHDPDSMKAKVQNTINRMKDTALNNLQEKPIHVIEHCVASTSSNILSSLPSNINLRQIIYRQRNKQFKIIEPDSIDFEINRDILKMNDTEEILIDKILGNERIIIYTTKKLLTLLCSSVYLIMDGTFNITPSIVKHIHTIHGCVNTKTFPMVITLCVNKDEITYEKLFSTLIDYCKSMNLSLTPKYILMDFDKASQISAKAVFKNSIIKCSYYHLGQIIYRQVQSAGFQELYGKDESFASEIKCILALAYLSAEEIPVYFDALMENISSESKIIAEWFKQKFVWGVIEPEWHPRMWSTFDLNEAKIPRTQNSAESWHNRFQNLIGYHGGFYFISKKILVEIQYQRTEIEKYLNEGPPRKKRKYTSKSDRIDYILKNKSECSNKIDFLKALAYHIRLI